MKSSLIILAIICIFCALGSDAFLFSKKKNGCDPNPCKNGGLCTIDKKDKMKYKCNCIGTGYYGKKCKDKTGCLKKPCKNGGICTNLASDPSKYQCTCVGKYVGKKCGKMDPCIKKNPCTHGVCKADEKGKAYCTCPPGWKHGFLSKKCNKRNCTITQFKGKHFTKAKVFIDKSLVKLFKKLDGVAKMCNIRVHSLRSFSLTVDPKKVHYDRYDRLQKNIDPHHYIGQGLHFNIYEPNSNRVRCNDICLKKYKIPVEEAKCFIKGAQAIGFYWSSLNPTVISTNLFKKNRRQYDLVREGHQVGCRKEKFY